MPKTILTLTQMPAVGSITTLCVLGFFLMGCSAAEAYSPPDSASYGGGSAGQDSAMVAQAESAPVADDRAASAPTGAANRHAFVGSTVSSGQEAPANAEPPQVEEEPSAGQLLIYSGAIILAIYDVEETQDTLVALVEEMGGYVSNRSRTDLTARVPAEKFRDAMERIGEHGDVLDRSWEAQDVTDQVRDLDIRLRNAEGLRDRLEALLDEVETVEEALEIERELERITLEIERIRGQRQSFEDRISYSTIQISFRSRRVDDVPDDEFLLPFQWLNTLGLQSLLRSPEVYR